jgi:hypothetical protein
MVDYLPSGDRGSRVAVRDANMIPGCLAGGTW